LAADAALLVAKQSLAALLHGGQGHSHGTVYDATASE